MKVRKFIKLVEEKGWVHVRTHSSHRQYKHDEFDYLITISGHLNDEIGKGLLNKIMKQAGLK